MKSHSLSSSKTVVVLFFVVWLGILTARAQSLTDYGSLTKLTPPPGDKSAANQKLDFHTDKFTGRFNYEVPIEVPPARQGTEPSITLQYNSANGNGWCGVGWDLDIGYIQRETRYGVPVSGGQYSDTYGNSSGFNSFTFSVAGQSGRLILASDGTYRPEINTAFLKFVRSGGSWLVYDKDGRVYTFGGSANSQINTAYGTFKWALSQIADANGNTTTISYQTADSSLQMYPYQVSYNASTGSPALSANCVVTFTLASAARADIPNSCLSGAEIDTTRLLHNVAVTCNGGLVREYVLAYTTSPSTGRSLLYSVNEYGTDGATAWPALTFSYSAQSHSFLPPVPWPITPQNTQDPSGYSPGSPYTGLIDMNGDGLPDWVTGSGPVGSTYTYFNVQANTGSGFGTAQRWSPLANEHNDTTDWYWNTLEGDLPSIGFDTAQVSSLIDINGDLLPDRVMQQYNVNGNNTYDHFQVQSNTGTGFGSEFSWTGVSFTSGMGLSGSELTVPFYTSSDGEASFDLLADMNGDGYADRVMIGSANEQFNVQLNNKNGTFGGVTAWTGVQGTTGSYPYAPRERSVDSGGYSYVYSDLIDMNGDGLPDRATQNGVQLNNGAGSFGSLENWYDGNPGTVFVQNGAYTLQLIDMKGDGLPDWVASNGNGTYTVWFNTGKGFSSTGVTWTGVSTTGNGTTGWKDLQSWDTYGTKVMFIDMNGDGLPDRVIRNWTNNASSLLVQFNAGPFPDLLTNVNNGIGGWVTVTYTNAAHWNNSDGTRPRLPLPLYTVTSVNVQDGIRAGNNWAYTYEGGLYDTTWREFRGFAEVSETDYLGRQTRTFFYQGGGLNFAPSGEYQDSRFKAGMPWDIETWGSDGQLYHQTINVVNQLQVDANGVYFPYVMNCFSFDLDPGVSARGTLKQFNYDSATGNLLQESDVGEVTNLVSDVNGDITFNNVPGTPTAYSTYTYATLSNPNIIDKPASVTVSSDPAGNNILRQTEYQYFGATGNLQEKSELICPSTDANTFYTYDNYGNVQTATDPMNVVSTTFYDSTATFPVQTITGTLTNGFQYDPRSGSVLYSTNAQGMVTANGYDVLLRLSAVSNSVTANGPPTLWRRQYAYGLNGISALISQNFVYVRQNDPANTSTGDHVTYTYLDGLGRPIQVRDQSEVNGFRVSDIFYNAAGELLSLTLPIFESGTSYAMPSGTPEADMTVFDPIERPSAFYPCVSLNLDYGFWVSGTVLGGDSGSPVGPTSIGYYAGNNPWAVVITDPRGKIHTYDLDAFGRTNLIYEVIGTTNYYATTLAYNPVGDLTNITDNAGNKIALFYDLTGNRVALADPDMGFWQWGYDLDGRLKTQTDAKNQQLKFYYNDPAGRLTRREGWSASGTCLSTNTWTYDSNGGDTSCTVYPGQVYQMTDDQGWQKFSYDARDRTLKSVRYLSKNGTPYTNQYTFDDADRLNSTIYPNGGPVVTNIFDNGGLHLSQVNLVGGAGTAFYTATGFNALNQLTGITFGNSVGTTLNYYSVSRRLQQIVSTKGTNVQNLIYSYDTDGNVTAIADGVFSGGASAAITSASYDDLNRLTAATWSGYGSKTYGFDSIGNVLTNQEFGVSNYVYGSYRPHSVLFANGMWFTYDFNGNTVFRSGQRLDYDVNNHLWRVINTNGLVTFFGYDANGARLWEQSGTNALQVWIDGNYEEKQGEILYHIYAGDRLVATFDKTKTNLFQYYQPNNLTSTSIQTDTNGAVIQHYEYSAFGQSRFTGNTNALKVSRRYTSQVVDDATSLYYYNARYYDPELGRFIQADTEIPDLSNPQSYNRYSYCVNDPLRYTDPTGHWGEEAADWWSGTVGSGANYISASPSHWIYNGTVGTVNSLVGGVAEPLRLGSSAGAVSGNPNATAGQIAIAGVQEVSRAAALIPAGAAIGKGTGVLLGAGEDEAAGEIAPKVLTLNGDKYPVSAANLKEAGAVNTPLTVNRAGAAANRAEALQGLPKIPGYDLDEAPPAMLRKPGDPVVVRPTPPADNRGAGASLGNQAKSVPEGGKVIIQIQTKAANE